ncbi:MAG TPA: hypothetical protein VN041_12175 [Microbacterium sp.]|nr:hypothetical protein [Microbacterium sp.]
MSTWFTATDETRLLAAWSDAPIENLEVCGMILEVAREQVIAYAPADTPAVYEPATLTWPLGSTATLTREGDIVTADVTIADPDEEARLPLPDLFGPIGTVYQSIVDRAVQVSIVEVAEFGALGINVTATGLEPITGPGTFKWVAGPADGDGVPTRYVYAQLQQAKNLLTAGTVSQAGNLGEGEFVFQPRPLDRTIKQIIRPVDGKPHVL